MASAPALDPRWAWFAFFQFISLPFAGYYLGRATDAPLLSNLLTPVYVFVVFPLLDTLIGIDERNPSAEDETALAAAPIYRALALAALPAVVLSLAWGAAAYTALAATTPVAAVVLAASIGLVSGAVGITYAHELIHKPGALERNVRGILLALVAYGGFKIEHIFGHHVDVATPRDTSTAPAGQSAYRFLLRAWTENPVKAWTLNAFRMRARGRSPWHWTNEMWWWSALTLAFAAILFVWQGPAGLAFFAIQSFVAITLLELVNYIEHYGLLRHQRPDGSYERVSPRHSWNDSHKLSNMVLLNLQRHSDHHAHAARRYPILRHHDDAPQLPTGYASLILLALMPPLWRRLMDPRMAAWQATTPG